MNGSNVQGIRIRSYEDAADLKCSTVVHTTPLCFS